MHGAWCLYEEIYKAGAIYEIYFLLNGNKLLDCIIVADDLEYQYDRQYTLSGSISFTSRVVWAAQITAFLFTLLSQGTSNQSY